MGNKSALIGPLAMLGLLAAFVAVQNRPAPSMTRYDTANSEMLIQARVISMRNFQATASRYNKNTRIHKNAVVLYKQFAGEMTPEALHQYGLPAHIH